MKKTPIKIKTHRNCEYSECGKEFRKNKSTDKYCSFDCQLADKGYPEFKMPTAIPKQSEKRKTEKQIYDVLRIEVLVEANFKCFIDGCTRVANTCEHTMGRKGYADDWARDNDISLYIDKRFLRACCYQHNIELENNPELAKQYQLSKIHGGKKD